MRLISITSSQLLTSALLCFFSVSAIAQETGLQSVLKGEDLRALIDLDAPDAPTPSDTSLAPKTAPNEHKAAGRLELAGPSGRSGQVGGQSKLSTPQPPRPITSDPLLDLGLMTTDMSGSATVRGVFVDSPAARSGFRAGDKIVSVGSKLVKSGAEFVRELSTSMNAADSFHVVVLRGQEKRVVNVDMKRVTTTSIGENAPSPQGSAATSKATVNTERSKEPTKPQSVLRRRVAAQQVSNRREVTTPEPVVNSPGASAVGGTIPRRPAVQAAQSILRRSVTPPNQGGTPSVSVLAPAAQGAPRTGTPRPYQVLGPPSRVVTQPRLVRQYAPQAQRYVPSQQVVIRGQTPIAQRPAAVPQGRYVPRQVQPARPMMGDGGRLIGNGRMINSALRVIGL